MSRYGSAEVSASYPRAHAVCDRCGRRTNHYKLRWQFDWQGPRMQNLRFLVCESCYDAPQQSGQRTILIPADPIPIMNPRPEQYVPDNNPLGGIGTDANPDKWQYGSMIGTMTEGGGVTAAFRANPNKPSWMCAVIATAQSSYNNYVGVNWAGNQSIWPPDLAGPVITHTVTSYTLIAPNDSTFGSTGYLIQGSPVDAGWGSWTTIASGNPAGTIGEEISGTTTGGRYQFHRVAFYSNAVTLTSSTGAVLTSSTGLPLTVGGGAIAVAQVEFNVAETGGSQ